jgi:hypothetical protein
MPRQVGRLAALALLALVSTGFLAPHPTNAAPAMASYKSAALHYSFSYPAAWMVLHVKGIDMDVSAPGHFAAFAAVVQQGTESAAALKANLKATLVGLGSMTSTTKFTVGTINGVTYDAWSASYSSNGKTGHAATMGTVHGKFTYTFVGAVIMGVSSTQANRTALNTLMASLTLN